MQMTEGLDQANARKFLQRLACVSPGGIWSQFAARLLLQGGGLSDTLGGCSHPFLTIDRLSHVRWSHQSSRLHKAPPPSAAELLSWTIRPLSQRQTSSTARLQPEWTGQPARGLRVRSGP